MDAAVVRSLFEAVLPRDAIMEAVKRLGVQKRVRHFDPPAMVMALVMLGGTAEAGRIGAALTEYFESGRPRVARSAAYRWFDGEFLEFMKELAAASMRYVGAMPVHLPGVLAGRRDWRAVDSTVVKLDNTLKDAFPGTGDYAALKVHVEISLGVENVVDYKITPARRHDSPELTADESRRGTGLLVDLGYVSYRLVQACSEHDVHLVVRLEDGWKVFIDTAVRAGELDQWQIPDELFSYFDGDSLPSSLEVPFDIDVRLGGPDSSICARLVNVATPEGFRAYLTTLPRSTHDADAVAFLYRLRWSIEIQNKLAKSCCQLDHIDAKKPVSAEILVHAAMIASMLANALAHLAHLDQGMVGGKVVRPKRPPHHAMLVWKCVVSSAWRIADLLAHPKAGQRLGWDHVASFLTRGGQDPNWRRKPSAIDDAKGRNAAGRAYWKSRPPPKAVAKRGATK